MKKGILVKAHCLFLAAAAFLAFANAASAANCDRSCLLEHARQFNANMLTHSTEKIPLAPGVQIRENTKAIALGESRWFTCA